MKSNRLSLSAFVALAAMLSVSPAMAQGKGNGNGHGRGHDDRPRTEARRDDDRRDDRRYDDRRDDSRFERRSNVPRGWCQGTGNPHNTARNCGYRGSLDGLYRDRSGVIRDRGGRVVMGDGRVYDERSRVYTRTGTTSRNSTYGNGGYNGGSYEAAHQDYHRWHDQQCRDRSTQVRSVGDRLRVAGQCKAEHDEWHRQQGTRH